MEEQDLDKYFKEMHRLKEKYKDQIDIKVGLELDFLPNHISWTRDILNEYGEYLDESILSIHFLKGNRGWRCVDLNPEDFKEGLLDFYKSFEKVQLEYYRVLKEGISTDYGRYTPRKIGHISLCQKFQHYFLKNEETKLTQAVENEILSSLRLIKSKNKKIDYNVAGLYKAYCNEPYPSDWIVYQADKLGIQFEY